MHIQSEDFCDRFIAAGFRVKTKDKYSGRICRSLIQTTYSPQYFQKARRGRWEICQTRLIYSPHSNEPLTVTLQYNFRI